MPSTRSSTLLRRSRRRLCAETLAADVPNIIVVHLSVPARSVKQLIALAKSKPGAPLRIGRQRIVAAPCG
jgi:hypothetical protein